MAGVAIDSVAGEAALLGFVRSTFREWIGLLASQLTSTGVAPQPAQAIALATVTGMERALILSCAEGGSGPFDAAATELIRLLPQEPD